VGGPRSGAGAGYGMRVDSVDREGKHIQQVKHIEQVLAFTVNQRLGSPKPSMILRCTTIPAGGSRCGTARGCSRVRGGLR
jgi:hypothetical protein